MQVFANAKTLAQTRRSLMEKVRQASGTSVKVFEKSMNNDLQVPSRTRGLSFLGSLCLFVAFISILSYESVVERAPLDGAFVQASAYGILRNVSDITQIHSLKAYLTYVLPNLSVQHPAVGNSRRVGSIRVRQLRTLDMCSGGSVWRLAANSNRLSCSHDVTRSAELNESDIVGPRTGVVFPFHRDPKFCVGLMCQLQLPSMLQDDLSYPYAGNSFYMDRGNLLHSNGSEYVTFDASGAAAGHNFTFGDVVGDFIDEQTTRWVLIEFTLYHPTTSETSAVLLSVEAPSSGGAAASIISQTVPLFDVANGNSVFLWAYAVFQILLQVYRLGSSLNASYKKTCVTCTQVDALIVFKCVKCKSPCELRIGKVSLCGLCGNPVPALTHSCWRSVVFDMWRLTVMLSVCALMVSRYATTLSVSSIDSIVMDPVIGAPSRQSSVFLTIAPQLSVFRQGQNTLLITIICTYLRLFHYVCRGQRGSQFARVMEYSMMPLLAFSFNFLVAYSGFCFAFNLVNGSRSASLSSLGNTYLTIFRFLLSQVSWSELGTVDPAMMALLVIYFIVCLCLMFNVFPSVLSVSYKKANRTPYYDVDVISLWLLVKRYLLVPLGVVKSRSASERRGSTASSASRDDTISDTASHHSAMTDSTHAQLAALRAGARMEDVMAQQELQEMIQASDALILKVAEHEETFDAAISKLQTDLLQLFKLFPAIVEESLTRKLPKPEPADVVDALEKAKSILDANRCRVDTLKAEIIALPIIEDSSLLAPVAGAWLPYQDSDEGSELNAMETQPIAETENSQEEDACLRHPRSSSSSIRELASATERQSLSMRLTSAALAHLRHVQSSVGPVRRIRSMSTSHGAGEIPASSRGGPQRGSFIPGVAELATVGDRSSDGSFHLVDDSDLS